jgi:lysozyme family protein
MRSNFEACLAEVLGHEGGYVNDPQDPGGETNMGICKRSYPTEDIRCMTRDRAGLIYRRDFWDKVRGDDLPAGLDLVAFDAAVNSGVRRGAKWLQSAVGADADGSIGEQTIGAAKLADPANAIRRACASRLRFLQSLATWGRFGKGWGRRVQSVETTALAMAN